jgi:hypothetical protein
MTGDGRADLLTRSASTGKLYVYANDGAGGFKAQALAGSGFGGYKRLVTAGDLGGDGKNDLLAIDASNELWRFNGTGAGTFEPRSLVFKDWGTSYKDVVGGLDLSGDGRADPVSLDKDDRAWLNRGNDKGGLDRRSQVSKSTNWSDIRISRRHGSGGGPGPWAPKGGRCQVLPLRRRHRPRRPRRGRGNREGTLPASREAAVQGAAHRVP